MGSSLRVDVEVDALHLVTNCGDIAWWMDIHVRPPLYASARLSCTRNVTM